MLAVATIEVATQAQSARKPTRTRGVSDADVVVATDEVLATRAGVSSAGELHETSPAATTPIAATPAIDHRRTGVDEGGGEHDTPRSDTTRNLSETNEIA